MEDVFRFADELGPAKLIHVHEPGCQLKGILVVDNVAAGPSIGGLRMAPDVSTEECFRLARAMTFKNAAAGLPHGGGKSVIFGDPKMPSGQKEELVRTMALALRGVDDYIFGPDMGLDESCMAWIRDEIGARALGLPRELGGIPLDEIGATGWGLLCATEVALSHCQLDWSGLRFVVQGFGAVGMHAAKFLAAKGAVLVGAADSTGATYDANGIDVAKLCELKKDGASVIDWDGGRRCQRDAAVEIDCDLLIPAARPDAITLDNAARIAAKLIVPGANIAITADAEPVLHEKGILCIPDFIANAGGVICAAMEYRGAPESTVFPVIADKIGRNTREVIEDAERRSILPRQAAMDMAEARVRQAMEFRRCNIFSAAPNAL